MSLSPRLCIPWDLTLAHRSQRPGGAWHHTSAGPVAHTGLMSLPAPRLIHGISSPPAFLSAFPGRSHPFPCLFCLHSSDDAAPVFMSCSWGEQWSLAQAGLNLHHPDCIPGHSYGLGGMEKCSAAKYLATFVVSSA